MGNRVRTQEELNALGEAKRAIHAILENNLEKNTEVEGRYVKYKNGYSDDQVLKEIRIKYPTAGIVISTVQTIRTQAWGLLTVPKVRKNSDRVKILENKFDTLLEFIRKRTPTEFLSELDILFPK